MLIYRCPGELTKEQTIELCRSSGGRLCTAAEREKLKGRKLGCSLDAYAVWAQEDKATGRKFARCCADYEMSVDCATYLSSIAFCQNQKVLWDCVYKGSGTAQQEKHGFGRMLDLFRERCANKEFGESCQGALMRPWYFREKCLWCPKLGESANEGDCRPGSDYGICPYAPEPAKRLFGVNLWNVCGKQIACNLKKSFPDIKLPASCN